MPTSIKKAQKNLKRLLNNETLSDFIVRGGFVNPEEKPLSESIPSPLSWNKPAQTKRLELLRKLNKPVEYICGVKYPDEPEMFKGNIENYIGIAQVPLGLVGPLRVIGMRANGDFYVPMATTEGALVASYNRGAKVVSLSGGVRSACLSEGVQRTPAFKFNDLREVGEFTSWLLQNFDNIKKSAEEHTRYGKLEDIRTNIDGNQVTLIFEYITGDASGQNMVTICTYGACKYIEQNSPVKPHSWYIEGNLSGDKKASSISFTSVRGKKVVAESVIKKELVEKILHTTPEKMFDYWKTAIVNGIQSGSIGVNGHFANGLAGIFLACGQDIATISEASVGITRFDFTQENDLYVSVTLPNLIVGTVGGGTGLPTQKECLEIIECYGKGKATKFAEICAASVLCGEVSIIGAIVSGDFARAHKAFGRKRK